VTVTLPETRYARNNGLHVAYQLVGDGPVDVVLLTQWFSNIDSQWDVPPLAAFIRRLARFGRVLTFDKRGTGLSDPVPASELPSIEEWMDDLRTVMDENGIDRAVLVANLASSFMAMVFAATYPARVRALVMVNAYPRFTRSADYPWGFDAGNFDMVMERTRRMWGKGMLLRQFAPSLLADATLVEQESRYERQAASPGTAMAMTRMINLIDVRSVLPTITVPTMVISRADPAAVPAGHRRYVADHVHGARYVELAGADELMWAGDQDALVGEVQEFVTGARPVSSPCSTVPAAPSGVRPPPARACSRSESRSGPAFTPARSRWPATGSGASLSTSVPVCRPSRAQVRSSSARPCATWSQGRVCNSKTVVPASSKVCPTHGGFSRLSVADRHRPAGHGTGSFRTRAERAGLLLRLHLNSLSRPGATPVG
jgi:pimeloyl-ACP methyl ester carboxylesterase